MHDMHFPVLLILAVQPVFPHTARLYESLLQCIAIFFPQQGLQHVQLVLKSRQLLKKRLAIGQADIAPHFRRTAGDSGKVAEAASGKAQQVFRTIRAVAQMIHQCECQNMRQVAGGGENAIVHPRQAHLQHVSPYYGEICCLHGF